MPYYCFGHNRIPIIDIQPATYERSLAKDACVSYTGLLLMLLTAFFQRLANDWLFLAFVCLTSARCYKLTCLPY